MKLSCLQENLNKAISIVSKVVATRSTLPVLSNILIKTEKGRLKLSATNLEIGISCWIGSKIEKEGSITIPARLFSDFVATNTDKTIAFELENTSLSLKSEHFFAHIKGIEASEFPLIPQIHQEPFIELPVLPLKEAITQTVFAVAIDETRPVLTGVLLRFVDDKLKIAATDSYRLAERQIELPRKVEKNVDLIVPAKTILELARIMSDSEQAVTIRVAENQVQFDISQAQVVSRLIEGSFPQYEQIIPSQTPISATVPTADFQNAIKMASLFARESADNIKLKIKKDNNLEIVAISPQAGDSVSNLSAQTTGEIEIAFNAKYLSDVLPVLGAEKLELLFSGPLSPGLVRPKNSKDYLYIIMPLKTEE